MNLMKLLQIFVDKEPVEVYLIHRILALDISEC